MFLPVMFMFISPVLSHYYPAYVSWPIWAPPKLNSKLVEGKFQLKHEPHDGLAGILQVSGVSKNAVEISLASVQVIDISVNEDGTLDMVQEPGVELAKFSKKAGQINGQITFIVETMGGNKAEERVII